MSYLLPHHNMADDITWHPTAYRTHTLGEIQNNDGNLVGEEVKICGFMEANRGKGKICFIDLRDGTGKIQVFLKLQVITYLQKNLDQLIQKLVQVLHLDLKQVFYPTCKHLLLQL